MRKEHLNSFKLSMTGASGRKGFLKIDLQVFVETRPLSWDGSGRIIGSAAVSQDLRTLWQVDNSSSFSTQTLVI